MRPGRKRKTPVTLAETAMALGATEQRVKQANGHIDLICETTQREAIVVRFIDWPLAVLQKRGDIESVEYEALDALFGKPKADESEPIPADD